MTEEIHMDEFFFFTYDSILKKLGRDDEGYTGPVSYTHLTLPTT